MQWKWPDGETGLRRVRGALVLAVEEGHILSSSLDANWFLVLLGCWCLLCNCCDLPLPLQYWLIFLSYVYFCSLNVFWCLDLDVSRSLEAFSSCCIWHIVICEIFMDRQAPGMRHRCRPCDFSRLFQVGVCILCYRGFPKNLENYAPV